MGISVVNAQNALDMIGEIWKAIQAAGILGAMICFLLWKRADEERLRLQKEKDELIEKHHKSKDDITERAIAAINDTKMILAGLKDLFQASKGRDR